MHHYEAGGSEKLKAMSELSFRPARVPTNDSKNSVTSTESTSKRPSASAPSSGGEAQSINQSIVVTSTPSTRRSICAQATTA